MRILVSSEVTLFEFSIIFSPIVEREILNGALKMRHLLLTLNHLILPE